MSKELKKLMTKVAKGEITEKEAELAIKPKKSDKKRPKREKKHTRKRSIKSKEVK